MSKQTLCIYLHGFASGPKSEKAMFFKHRFAEAGITMLVPDLNEPSFEEMTLTRQMDQVRQLLRDHQDNSRIILAGSSMGGLVATMLTQHTSALSALILFAPGFGLQRRWRSVLGENGLEQWQKEGIYYFQHHMHNVKMPLRYSFVQDMQGHDSDHLKIEVPTILFHGSNDDVVPIEESERFAKTNQRSVQMHILDSDHGLLNVLPDMWKSIADFLGRLDLIDKDKTANFRH